MGAHNYAHRNFISIYHNRFAVLSDRAVQLGREVVDNQNLNADTQLGNKKELYFEMKMSTH